MSKEMDELFKKLKESVGEEKNREIEESLNPKPLINPALMGEAQVERFRKIFGPLSVGFKEGDEVRSGDTFLLSQTECRVCFKGKNKSSRLYLCFECCIEICEKVHAVTGVWVKEKWAQKGHK